MELMIQILLFRANPGDPECLAVWDGFGYVWRVATLWAEVELGICRFGVGSDAYSLWGECEERIQEGDSFWFVLQRDLYGRMSLVDPCVEVLYLG